MQTNLLFGAVLAILLLAQLSGCGGSVESSSTGTSGGGGGQGGSGGTTFGGSGPGGGTVGTGGMVEGTCSDAQLAVVGTQMPPLGFSNLPPDNMGATIVSVSPTVIEYTLDGTGESGKFLWEGPDLTGSFQPGDMVAVGTQEGWQYVAFNTIVATRVDYNFIPPSSIPAVPMSKSPPMEYASECTFVDFAAGCGQDPGLGDLLAVSVGAAPDTVLVPGGATTTFGPFDITNVTSVAAPGYASDMCIVEAYFGSALTVRGPVGK
ncbi:MAG: hypothetical protein IPK82_19860 [Polyangiaceae bacterium]|nr:hypothetical protein [Polyangiaceae bacterium]